MKDLKTVRRSEKSNVISPPTHVGLEQRSGFVLIIPESIPHNLRNSTKESGSSHLIKGPEIVHTTFSFTSKGSADNTQDHFKSTAGNNSQHYFTENYRQQLE
jgi:hypothetical protein